MIYFEKLDLQLFAEGGEDGGDGAATGVTSSADAGQAALEALGVPKSKMRSRAKEAAGAMVENRQAQQKGQVAADGGKSETGYGTPAKPSWKDLMKDPEYNAAMQETVQNRLKSSKSAKDMEALAPALAMLAGRYKLDADPEKLDVAALAKAIQEDDSYFEMQAAELGVEPDVARRLAQLEQMEKQKAAAEQKATEQEQTRAHLMKLSQQAETLKQKFPQFDLMQELKNPTFARLTAPALGMSVEAAYHAVHYAEIQQQMAQTAMQRASENIAASIAAGKSRPAENGAGGQAPSRSTANYDNMTKAQREDLKRRIRSGEKIYPV